MSRALKDTWLRGFFINHEKPIAILIIIISISAILTKAHLLTSLLEIKRIDFYYYWIMARMFLSNSNPYDPTQFFNTLQIYDPGQVIQVIPYYPPWILPLLAPLGLMPYSISHLIWFGTSLFLLFYIIMLAWKHYHGDASKRWVALLITVIYFPIIFALYQGQATILTFIGLAGFIFSMKKGKHFIAGIFLIPLSIKPHIVYLVFFSIIIFVIYKRLWKVVLGGAIPWIVLIIIAVWINPPIIKNYVESMISNPPTDVLSVSLYGMVSGLLNKQISSLIYLPMLVGVLITSIYFIIQITHWDWLYHLNLPIILSLLTTPYAWIQDGIILVIPIIYVIVIFTRLSSWKFIHYVIIFCFLVLNGLSYKFNNLVYPAHLLFWIPFGFCAIWLISIFVLKETAPNQKRVDLKHTWIH